jgi:hypothetical protein
LINSRRGGIMARKFTAIRGNATVRLEGPLQSLFEDTLRKAYPEITKTLETTLQKIKRDAEREWPVRRRKSQRSVDQFEITFGLTTGGIVVSLENEAEYAAGILGGKLRPSLNQFGRESTLKPGRLAWWYFLYTPSIKAADKVVQELANELMREMERAD